METFQELKNRLLNKVDDTSLINNPKALMEKQAWDEIQSFNEIRNTQKVVFNSIVDRLFPEIHTRARPAHAVLHAQTKEDEVWLSDSDEFYTSEGIYFCPLGLTKLTNSRVMFITKENSIYNVKGKEVGILTDEVLKSKSSWIGIKIPQIEKKEEIVLNFFLSFGENYDPSLIDLIRWSYNGVELGLKKGFSCLCNNEIPEFVDREYLRLKSIKDSIYKYYSSNFVSLKIRLKTKGELPASLLSLSKSKKSRKLLNDLVWLKLEFPENFNSQLIENLEIRLNCLPVWNARIERGKDQLAQRVMVIPLMDENTEVTISEHFLGIKRVWSDDKIAFEPASFTSYSEAEDGSYAIQHSNLGSFNHRELAEKTIELCLLLKDTQKAFGLFEREALGTILENININIQQLEEQLKEVKTEFTVPNYYLHIKPDAPGKMIYLEYLKTQGDVADQLDFKREILLTGEEVFFEKDGLVLLNRPSSGKAPLNKNEIDIIVKNYFSDRLNRSIFKYR